MVLNRKPNLKRWIAENEALKQFCALDAIAEARAWLYGAAVIMALRNKKSFLYNVAVSIDFTLIAEQVRDKYPDAGLSMYSGDLYVQFTPDEIICVTRAAGPSEKRQNMPILPSLKEVLAVNVFPVMAMAVELTGKLRGRVVDYFGGYEDFSSGRIRRINDNSMRFSPQEIMLYAVLVSEFVDNQANDDLQFVADIENDHLAADLPFPTAYLMQILQSEKPSAGLIHLFKTGLLKLIFPEAANLAGVEQVREHQHKDVFYHTCTVIDNVALVTNNLWLRFAALVHDIAKPHTKKFIEGTGWSYHGHEEIGARLMKGIFKRLQLPVEKLDYIQRLIRLHLRPSILASETVTDSAIRRLATEAGPFLQDLMKLCRADITSKNLSKVSRFMKNYDYVEKRIIEVREKDELAAFQSPVRGEDIMRICGIPPSKRVGDIKEAIEQAILSGEISNDYDSALAYLYKIKDAILNQ